MMCKGVSKVRCSQTMQVNNKILKMYARMYRKLVEGEKNGRNMFTFPCPQSADEQRRVRLAGVLKKPDVTTELICLSMFTVSEYSQVQFNNTQNNCNYKNLSHIKSSFCNFFTEQLQIIGFKNGAVSVGELGRGSGQKQQKILTFDTFYGTAITEFSISIIMDARFIIVTVPDVSLQA